MKKDKETKILIHLSEKENKIVEIYKTVNNLQTKQEAIKKIIQQAETTLTKGLRNATQFGFSST